MIRRQIRDCALFIPVIPAKSRSSREGYFRLEWDLAGQRIHRLARDRALVYTDDPPAYVRGDGNFSMTEFMLRRAGVLVTAVAALLGPMHRASCADAATAASTESRCGRDETWDATMGMCMPGPGVSQSTDITGEFNVFGVFSALAGPRGVNQFAAPNWFMIEAGRSLGAKQFLNLELMGTTELWTYPRHGYPELLQVGEERNDGSAYIDAQHPHTSPVMGLTLSDTIAVAKDRSLKLYFAPRGESTDGPVAYMHRASARDNPDAPLGHHVGQDIGHISSTVLGAGVSMGQWLIEGSAFNGAEPAPARVNLTLGPLDSAALRLTYMFRPNDRVMASVAQVKQVDPAFPGTTSATRLSASIYDQLMLRGDWSVDHAFVAGSIRRHPVAATLTSFLDEVTAARAPSELWVRLEVLQRLAAELRIPDTNTGTALNDKRWISALTIGYTYWKPWLRWADLGIGLSVTADAIPGAWESAYGSRAPLTARLIVQTRGASHSQQ